VTRRLLFGYLGLALFVLVAFEVPLGIQNQRNERTTLEQKLEHDATTLGAVAEDALTANSAPQLRAVARYAYDYASSSGARVVIVDRNGNARIDTSARVAGAESFASRPEVARALRGEVATGTRRSETLHTSLLYVAAPVSSGGVVHGAVRVTFPTSEVDRRIRRYWLLLGLVAVTVLVLAAAAGIGIARFVTRPLRSLEDVAAAVGAGDLDARAPETDGPPEVRSLARVFNDTVGTVQTLLGSQQEFVADASHELRTPLTALRLRLETGDVDGALRELDRLGELVEGLLALARADAGAEPAAVVDAAVLVGERVEHWRPLAEERGVTLAVAATRTPVRAGASRLTQVVDNLLANALDAARSTVGVDVRDGRVAIVDDGPGLTEEERVRAFDRFWSKRDDGTGLGLAIVARLVAADGGTVRLEEAPGGGLAAVVELRRA
jgi:signal transduction histidine kinase